MIPSLGIGRPRRIPALLLMGALAAVGCRREPQPDTSAARDTMAVGPTVGAAATGADSMSVVGLRTPESVLYDSAADIYIVSNVDGDPVAKDGNGFISRLRPDGTIERLMWIGGDSAATHLNAPKGLAIKGDTLFVADIDTVRAFDRTSGAPLGTMGVPGATFLNDLTVASDGTLYVSDSGLKEGLQPSGTDAIYRFEAGRAVAVVRGDSLRHPNGLLATDRGLLMVPFGGSAIYRISEGVRPQAIATLPAGQLDGIVQAPDGAFLVSSWETGSVYRVTSDTTARPTVAAPNVESPADIGLDPRRGRLLVPLFTRDRVEIRPLR